MKHSIPLIVLVALMALVSQTGVAGWLSDPPRNFGLQLGYERGYVGVLAHTIQFGRDGTRFDYVREGNQNILFPFERLSAELHLRQRHGLIFLVQPLDVRTAATLRNPLIVDTDTFPAGTPMDLRYGFDFYRLSYQYDFWPEPDRELAAGVSLQLRDASIAFGSRDGKRLRVYQDVGPVPILRLRTRLPISRVMWAGAEVDGFYAQGRVVTGSTNVESTFRGAILDAALRYGLTFRDAFDGFLNVRYLGGGASGQQQNPENPGDGYTDNWLGTVSLTVGCYVR